MLGLSLGPGIGYMILAAINDVTFRAVAWYAAMVLASAWGYRLYRQFDYSTMSTADMDSWYHSVSYFYYLIFFLWTVVFLLFAPLHEVNMHYIAIFTQIGASVVASTLLFSDRRLFVPIIPVLIVPLALYFLLIGTWYGYVLTIFSLVFLWVLYYSSSSSNQLLQKTNFQASHDQLTGLFNRNYFIDAMQQVINTLRSNQGYCSLLLIDLDHFKTINDSLGHDVGDVLLMEASRRMQSLVARDAVVARMGGDEFIIVGEVCSTYDECYESSMDLAENLRESLKSTYAIENHNLYISASIGISILHKPELSANQYIKEADIAMYEVKHKGRDGIVVFGAEVAEKVERNLDIETQLHNALSNNELTLNYQPQLDREHKVAGCEVLLRWRHEKLGQVSPAEFIPVAEKTGLIIEIGNFVIEQSFRTLRDWYKQGNELKQLSINVSMRQFFHHDFIDTVERLSHHYLNEQLCRCIVFELTESVMAEEIESLVGSMNRLRDKGFRFSIDDFGTGYSSLSYLRKVPLDEIKIDRSFIEELGENASDQSMIEMIMNLSRVFGMKVVAEGVETPEQENILLNSNCDLLQGYLFSRPLSRQEFEKFYRDQQ